MTEKVTGFDTVRPAPNLTEQVIQMLVEQITSGRFKRGQALPSEQAMADSFGVSRTVIREAIARLKAEGLVVTRQGRGALIASNVRQFAFKIDPNETDTAAVLRIVEFRIGFETEAAALAARRRGEEHLADMRGALAAMAEAITAGAVEKGVDADFRFHRAICAATGNPYFLSFFDFLSQFLREGIHVARANSARRSGAGAHAQREHEAIYRAIDAGDAEAAREAARVHVANTARRLSGTFSGEGLR